MSVSRVALVSPYALSSHGGVQEQALAMSRELERRGVTVLLCAPDQDDRSTYDTPARVVRLGRRTLVPANGSRAPLGLDPRAARQLTDEIHSFSPDVVHVHEPFAPVFAWRLLREHETPIVATFHRSGAGPAVDWTKPLLRRLANHIDVACAVSEAAAATAMAASGVTSLVLFNGFEVERFREFPVSHNEEAVIFVLGRLEERKGVAVAVDALRGHDESTGRPWRLMVAGDGPERERLVARASNDSRVQFLGALSDEEKRRWLRRADVVVAPALRGESFGLILLEAMAAETPVIASDIEGYRAASAGHAVHFRPGDADDLRARIVSVLTGETPVDVESALAHARNWSMSRLMDLYVLEYERARKIHLAAQ